jgi:hypothetical protein
MLSDFLTNTCTAGYADYLFSDVDDSELSKHVMIII